MVFRTSVMLLLPMVIYVTPFFSFFFLCSRAHLDLHSFPTRRSSDLYRCHGLSCFVASVSSIRSCNASSASSPTKATSDRKSTRLNSSHVAISYAVFCLKKKKDQLCSFCRS